MDYLKEYRSFISSHYLNEGIRVTSGILIPSLVMGHFGNLGIGITASLGALAVSIADNPGPIHHRRNGMLVSAGVAFIMALISGYASQVSWLFIVLLPVFAFFFSMIGVYGTRATAIGLAALLVLILQTQHQGDQVLTSSLYLLAGGIWYLLLSLGLYTIRPYKLIQQALGEYVQSSGNYLRAKAKFYIPGIDTTKPFQDLLQSQISVQANQNLIAELLFKTRGIVKESTNTSRILMMVFLDISDLFERAMTAHQDYQKLHNYFGNTGVMQEYRLLILALADELDEIGIALQSGRRSTYSTNIAQRLVTQRERLQEMRLTVLTPENIDGFISLRHILDSIEDIAGRIRVLHQHTSYKTRVDSNQPGIPDAENFTTKQQYDPKLFIDNISFRSNIFRHSLRIALAAICAYAVGLFFPLGHSYWILLTVIVILKPAYSLTKKRNVERLAGTVIGAGLGAALLFLVQDNTAILILMAISMAGTYSFIRRQYFVAMILMTMYLLLMFHLLEPVGFTVILRERIIDTAIGSAIAFLFSSLLSPIWEHEQIDEFMAQVIQDNLDYYESVSAAFTGQPADNAYTDIKRKDSWVSLANLSDAFQRMLSEPKSKQINIRNIHQFVVSNHMLTSHIATLAYYADTLQPEYISSDYQPVIAASKLSLKRTLSYLRSGETPVNPEGDKTQMSILDKRVNALMLERQKELSQGKLESSTRKMLSVFKSITDQFYFIFKTTADIEKITRRSKHNL
ncbi:MAG: FUSC family protein [Chitinophagaceae bacterium]|nr:MAG: FUSC family protein [Chitinophagaceae bacterium]